jgi:hypothetical protein
MATDNVLRLIVNGSRRPLDDLRRGLVRQWSRRVAGRTWSERLPSSIAALYDLAPEARPVKPECPGETYDVSRLADCPRSRRACRAAIPTPHPKFRGDRVGARAVSRVSNADVPPIDAPPGWRRLRIVLRRAWPRQTVAARMPWRKETFLFGTPLQPRQPEGATRNT